MSSSRSCRVGALSEVSCLLLRAERGGGSQAKSGNEPKAHGQIFSGESAGCETLSAERPADEIPRPFVASAVLPAATTAMRGWRIKGINGH